MGFMAHLRSVEGRARRPNLTANLLAPSLALTAKMKLRVVIFVLAGALVGFLYQRLVGCRTGTCAITSNPYAATFYGAFMGYLVSGGANN